MERFDRETIDLYIAHMAERRAKARWEGEANFINSPQKLLKKPPSWRSEAVMEYFPQGPHGRTWFRGYVKLEHRYWVNHHPACNVTCEYVTEEQFKHARVLYALQVLEEAKLLLQFTENQPRS